MDTIVSIPSQLGRIKELTNQLSREESMVVTFFKVCPDMLCIIDSKGSFIEINDAWKIMLHWDQKQLISEYLATFVHSEDATETHRIIRSLKKSQIIRFCNRFKIKDGGYKPLEWIATLGVDGNIYASARVIPQECFECERTRYHYH